METRLKTAIHRRIILFMVLLCLSGLTAIPIEPQLRLALDVLPKDSVLHHWLAYVLVAYTQTAVQYPFLLYGYDWLAFAHIIIALFFIGPYKDPIQNQWVIEAGLWACVLVIPFAFVAGHFRGIPLWWRFADCSFGVFGFLLLWNIRTLVNRLSVYQNINAISSCTTSNT